MKKFYLSICSLLAVMGLSAQVNVTFNVDMTNVTVSPNGVHVAGNFNDPDQDGTVYPVDYNAGYPNWTPNAIELTDGDADGIYSVVLSLYPARYEFKFINDNNWPGVEDVPSTCQVEVNGNDNRQILVADADTEFSVCYAQCVACGENAVRFRIDMSTQGAISPNGVHVAGNFQNPDGDPGDWTADATPLQDWNEDGVWEAVVTVGAMTSIEYKYINGNDWGNPNETVVGACSPGNGNRLAEIADVNTTLPAYCWSLCETCSQPVNVTFSVDMTASCADVSEGLNLMGTLTDWSTGAPMTDMGGGVWSITVGLQPGSYSYKYRIGGGGWEGIGDRPLTVVADTPQTLPTVCFSSDQPCPIVNPPTDVTFSVLQPTTGVPAGQYMWVMGNFTSPNWQPGALQMSDSNADGIWEAIFPDFCPASAFFKFVIGADNTNTAENWLEESADFSALPGSCGVDNGTFSDNRQFLRTSPNDTTICFTFDSCDPCVVSVNETDLVTDLKVFPVPAEDLINVSFNAPFAQKITLSLINSLGQVVVAENLGTISGNRLTSIPVNKLAKGIYTLEISNGLTAQTIRVAVK
ncbi:MAG: T9SS type A sorting domain-containing protein [Flavobacteriales bacterium]